MEPPRLTQDTAAWIAFTYIAFALSLGLMCLGIAMLPVTLWIKGYFAMGLFFTVASTLTLSKTIRDNHETRKIINRVQEAKTEKMLHEYELAPMQNLKP